MSAGYSSLTGSDNVNCNKTTDSHNNIGNTSYTNNINTLNINNGSNGSKVIADENQEMMRWLSPLDPMRRHQDVCTGRFDGVGNWFLETNQFREWRRGEGGIDKAVLFCYGNLGVGKTYLSSLVIDTLRMEPGEEDIAIAGFYCDFHDQQSHTATNIAGAILKQLVTKRDVLGHVQRVFQKGKNEHGGRELRLPDAVQLLRLAVATLPQVFICIDALDECLPEHLTGLLRSLQDILQESPRVRIFVTGRPHVKAEIAVCFARAVIVLISPKVHEIKRYLERKLEMDTDSDAMSDVLRADILRIIPERISEIFLPASLNIDAILEEITIFERRQKLNEMTKDNYLEDVYATTLARVRAQKENRRKLGMQALMWVSNSERPLHTRELCHALGVRIGSKDLDLENVPAIRTLLSCSLGLITVDSSSSTVRLVHLTLQKYLSNNSSLFKNPHSMIAEVCLTYLHFRRVRELSPTLSSASSIAPLVTYASCYWGKHIKMGKMESVSQLALGLLAEFEKHISSQLLLLHYHNRKRWWEQGFDKRGGPNGFSGLHGAAFLGIVEIVTGLLETKRWDINATDAMGRTALAWAVAGGHEDVVKILLRQKDINPNPPVTEHGQTALSWAAEGGREGVVKLLLEREDIDPNTADTRSGRAPLSLAAWGGFEGVVKLLLAREGINPDFADTRSGRTPLWWAARCGRERVVKLLLEREDIDPNTADVDYGQTPLSVAAEDGYEGVVKLLLERPDIKPDIPDLRGKTALELATSREYTRVVELLSQPNLPLPVLADIDKVPEHPSPEPPDVVQSPLQPISSVDLAPPESHLSDTRSLLLVIFSLIVLFYFFAVIHKPFLINLPTTIIS